MNKINVFPVLFFIIPLVFIIVESINPGVQSNLNVINRGIVHPLILSSLNIHWKRSVDDLNGKITVSVEEWVLLTTVNKQSIISPNFTFNWITSDDSKIPNINSPDNCRVSQGHVKSYEDSFVVMTICDAHFYIIFSLNDQMFVVYPLNNGSHILEETNSMMKYNPPNSKKLKRNVDLQLKNNYFNLSGDTFDLIDDIGPTNVEKKTDMDSFTNQSRNGSTQENVSSLSYFTSEVKSKDKVFSKIYSTRIIPTKPIIIDEVQMSQPVQWLELGVAVDYSVIEFHGERIQQYIFALLNIVRTIYRDPSLGANLTIVIVRIIFYIDKNNKMIYQGNARKSLENVNKWNRKILSSSNKLHDVAVWLTRLDIGGPSGYAPVSGACDPSRSCALNRDEGLTSAFIIAHEIAHILGLTHDGDEASDNSCSHEASEGSIMAPVVSATFHRFHWSSCSRKEFYHRSKQWECMNNPPSFNNSTHLKTTLRDTFTMDEQCRMEFGDGYELCKRLNLPGICIHLWCAHKDDNQTCKTKKGPPLEGTQCDKDKWCINGYCKAVDDNLFTLGSSVNNLVDGKWSPWSLWSKCSVTCGIGVLIRRRQCNNPIPFSDGRDCDGNSTDFRICKEKDCPQIIDLRSEQCSQLTNIIKDRTPLRKNQVTWLPYEHEDKSLKCRLTCRNVETKEIYISNDFLIDGTRCSYDSTNICIQGKCHLMGCDNVLYSEKDLDQCGICDGDNSTCISVSNKFQRRIRRATTRVVIVPPASYDIFVSVKTIPMLLEYESSKIVFRDAQRRKHEISLNSQSYVTVMIVEGTKFKIQRNGNQYEITGRGPTLATVTISLKIPKYEVKKSLIILVNFCYMTNRENEDSSNKYSWISGGWSPCSHSCGGGVRYRTIACRNEQDGRIVSSKKCTLVSKPTQEMEKCNTFSCQFKWITGMWEGCTKTCGASGVQQRQIYCVHSSFFDNYVTNDNEKKIYQVMVPPDLCNQYQLPKNQQECNRIPCQGNWIFTDWSPCTRSCAKGIQSRMARCVPPEAENLFTCNGTAPNELRTCKNSEHKLLVCKKNCKRNKSRYCVIPNLKKYCIIPEFYKRCCRTCLN